MERRHFSGLPSSSPSTTSAANTSGNSLKGVYLQMRRKKKPDEEQESELRSQMKQSSDNYFANAKRNKERMAARIARKQSTGNAGFHFGQLKHPKYGSKIDERENTGPKQTPVKYAPGPHSDVRPTGPKPSGQTGQSFRTIPELGGRNPRNLNPRQLAMLRRLRKQRGR